MTPSAAEREWKTSRRGRCSLCSQRGVLVRHHVVYRQHVRREGGDEWDLRNALDVGMWFVCNCHANHHAAVSRIPRDRLPEPAIAFARDLLGKERGEVYIARYYAEA